MKKKNVDYFPASLISAISALSIVSLTSGAVAMPQTENLEVAAPISLSSETLELTTKSEVSFPQSQQWLSLDEIVAQTQTNNVTEAETVERVDEYSQISEPTVEPETWLRIEQITNPESTDVQTAENLDVYGEVVEPLDQINSVNQLRDVSPSDWAYEALRGLIDRYGCIQGYPDGTFRGNRAMTRYEFAAGLSACLDSLSEIIARSQSGQQQTTGVSEADLETLRRLQQDFQAELATLDTRVDGLESQLAALEANQFSTTTKLSGYIGFGIIDYFSGNGETNTVLDEDITLTLSTSFTGSDLLEVALFASNINNPQFDTPNNGRQVGSTSEATTSWGYGGGTDNDLYLSSLDYTFTAFDAGDFKAVFTVFTQRGFGSGGSALGPEGSAWLGPGRPISAFASRSPVFRLNGRSGIITRFQLTPKIRIGGTYQANPGSSPDRGLFNGDYFAAAQIILNPNDNLALALTYANLYSLPGEFKFGRQRGNPNINSNGFLGTALANTFDNAGVFLDRDVPVVANVYSLQGFYQLTPKINLGGFVTKIDARLIGAGDADLWSYAGMLTLTDLFKQGNVGGLIIGMEPTLTNLAIAGDEIDSFADDTSLHIEGYYLHRLSRNIFIKPGFIWITAPNQDNDNEDIFLATVRMFFAF
ncbi:MAG: iron uptake porin [Oscillatoria sp. PMC 1068.18]|nr:iron uptake porin [Oscillatoria sp. PMC 1076.18]MEC4988357.1 iron uptake porin [Oscillatoria sp. PMC 1068.18]